MKLASRKWHLFASIPVFLVYILIYWLFDNSNFFNLPELTPVLLITAFLLTLIGSEAPDWDLLLNWLQHRDIITHSILIPLFITGAFIVQKFLTPDDPSLFLTLIFSPLLFGFSSHLLLDLFPNINPEKEMKKGGITHTTALLLKGFLSGLTGVETIKALKGTYLIHLPYKMKVKSEKKGSKWESRRTFSLNVSRWWLFFNGILASLLAILLLVIYQW